MKTLIDPSQRQRLEGLEQLTLCAWNTASMGADRYQAAAASAARHGESMQLVTCQRIELYRRGDCTCDAPVRLRGREALLHLASVAAGLDAAVPGEEQVAGQVRNAAALAPAEMRPLADVAVGCAKHLRKHERLGGNAGELLDRGLALRPTTSRQQLLVLGSGHLARLVARRARHLGFANVVVASRRAPSPPWSDAGHFRFISLHDAAALDAVDVVVSCLGKGATVSGPSLPRAGLYVDLATPRTLPVPGAVTIAAILAAEPDEVAARRAALRDRLARLLDHRLARKERHHAGGVASLRATLESVRRAEADRIQRAHPELPPETIDVITRSLVNRLFHEPSERLRDIDDPRVISQFVEIFTPSAPFDEVTIR